MRVQLLLAFLTASVAAGCSSRDSAPPIVAETAPPTSSASSSALVKDGAAPVLVLSPAGARFGESEILAALDPDPKAGFDPAAKRSGKNDLYVVAIAKAIQDARAQKRITVSLSVTIDPKTPYRAVVEAFFTAGQNEISTFHIAESPAPKPRSVSFKPPEMPSSMPRPDDASKSLRLVVLLVDGGVSLKASGGNVAPGCNGAGPGLAFPRSPNGTLDLAGIRACVEHLVAATPTQETNFVVAASPSIPFSEVFDVVEAVRSKADGSPLLPDVTFGISR
jgi:hypothetical protein